MYSKAKADRQSPGPNRFRIAKGIRQFDQSAPIGLLLLCRMFERLATEIVDGPSLQEPSHIEVVYQ
jgi:hypothetical protein